MTESKVDHKSKIKRIFTSLIDEYPTMRAFARAIEEDASDVMKWKTGKTKVKARAVVSICRIYKNIKPYDLNPEYFPKDLEFVFRKGV